MHSSGAGPAAHRPGRVSCCAETRTHPLERSPGQCTRAPLSRWPSSSCPRRCPEEDTSVSHSLTAHRRRNGLPHCAQQVSRHQHVPLMHSAPPSRWASSSCPSRSPEEDTSMSQSSSSPLSPVLCWACRSPVDSAPLGCIAARLGALGETCTTVLCGGSTSKPQSPRLLHAGTARYQARCQARCNYLEKVSGGAFT